MLEMYCVQGLLFYSKLTNTHAMQDCGQHTCTHAYPRWWGLQHTHVVAMLCRHICKYMYIHTYAVHTYMYVRRSSASDLYMYMYTCIWMVHSFVKWLVSTGGNVFAHAMYTYMYMCTFMCFFPFMWSCNIASHVQDATHTYTYMYKH